MAYRDKDKEVAAKRRSYEKHREVVKERTRLRRQRLRDDNREKLEALLRASKCADCGDTDWVVLEFDHVTDDKSFNISTKMSDRTWEQLLEEIKKCEIVCANCHRKRTYVRAGGWRVASTNGW